MVEARNVLVGSSPSGYHSTPFTAYAECITLVQANADDWLAPKLKATDEQMIARGDREYLIRLATSDQACIHTLVRSGDGFDPNTADTLAIALELLRQEFHNLHFVLWRLNGADDVVKYKKWEKASDDYRLITMGRPGDTGRVKKFMDAAKPSPQHFLLGPELPDISSTAVRSCLRSLDVLKTATMLHPAVADWCTTSISSPYLSAARKIVVRREVRVLAVGGPSACGKTTLAQSLVDALGCPVHVFSADGFGVPELCILNDARRKCFEQPTGINFDLLVSQLQHVTELLGTSQAVPEVVIQRRPHKGPLSLSKVGNVGKPLGPGPVYVIMEGFLLFTDPRICAMLYAALMLEMDEATGAKRRFEREGLGTWNLEDPICREYAGGEQEPAGHNYNHIWQHHVLNKPAQLQNVGSRLAGTIEINARTRAEVTAEALRLLSNFAA